MIVTQEALANGTEPPPRPKPYFVPTAKRPTDNSSGGSESSKGGFSDSLISGKNLRAKSNKSSSNDKSNKAFGSNTKK